MYCGVGILSPSKALRFSSRGSLRGGSSHGRCCRAVDGQLVGIAVPHAMTDLRGAVLVGCSGGADSTARTRGRCVGMAIGSPRGFESSSSVCTGFTKRTLGKAVRAISGVLLCGRSIVTNHMLGKVVHVSYSSLYSRLAGGSVH